MARPLRRFFSRRRAGLDAIGLLMDRELPAGERERVAAIAASVPGVRGVHGLRTRQSGRVKVIQLHLELADELPLIAAHRISMRVDRRLRREILDADITIHQDPQSLGTEGENAPPAIRADKPPTRSDTT
jgi:ferrous-iron efflux pump FieF